ncbi:hypothetical protein CH375_22330 [Leptospira ellisii]|nr:hypothetical protein CH375_22330 [Leptospira ellisii]
MRIVTNFRSNGSNFCSASAERISSLPNPFPNRRDRAENAQKFSLYPLPFWRFFWECVAEQRIIFFLRKTANRC